MIKVYDRTYSILLFFLVLIISACIFAPLMLKDKMYILFFTTTTCGIILLVLAPATFTEKIIITDNSILKSHKFPTRSYEIKFDEITEIIDDDISTLGISMHVIHLIPKKEANKKFKYFTIHGFYKNRKDLISDILSRIGPNVHVEDEVYQYIGKGHSKTVTK